MPRPSNTLQRREQIVGGLLTVMAERGYQGASVARVAQQAGLAPGLVHYHFENKGEILLALVERLLAQVRSRAAAAGRPEDSPRQRLAALIDAHLKLGADADPRAVAAWSIIGSEALREPEVRRLYRAALAAMLRDLRKHVRDCLRVEHRLTRNAGRIAAALAAAIEGAFRIAAAAPGALPRGYAAPMVRRMAEGLIVAEPHQ